MRRGRRRQSVRDYSRDVVSKEIRDALTNRWKLLSPFPLDPREIHQVVFTPEVHAAAKVIKEVVPSMLRHNNRLVLQWRSDAPMVANPLVPFIRGHYAEVVLNDFRMAQCRPTHIYVILPDENEEEYYLPGEQKFFVSRLPAAMREVLVPWAHSYIKHKLEEMALKKLTDQVFYACNTLGQVKRAWPNLMNFMPTEQRQKVEQMKCRSKMPEGFDQYQADGELFSYKNIEAYDTIITEALILPKMDTKLIAELAYEPC